MKDRNTAIILDELQRDNKGRFAFGNTGKPKGTINKVTNDLREKMQFIVSSNIDTIQSDLDSLEPKDRIKTLLELSKFVIPTLKAVDTSIELGSSTNNDQPNIIVLGSGIKPNED
jgi:hypothetical protein